jgi:hypothetical protein
MSDREHICKTNEHIASLAVEEGIFDWHVLWNANTELQTSKKRSDPSVLYKAKVGGDRIKIPKNQEKKESCTADDPPPTCVFKVTPSKLWLRLRILKEDFNALEDVPYELDFLDGAKWMALVSLVAPFKRLTDAGQELPLKGKTKAGGIIEYPIPLGLEAVSLTIRVEAEDTDPPPKEKKEEAPEGAAEEPEQSRGPVPIVWKLEIGKLNPVCESAPNSDCISGVQQRLNNLNINTGPVDGILGPNTRSAIRAFKEIQKVKSAKGHEEEPDGVTQDRLKQVHDDAKSDPKPPA